MKKAIKRFTSVWKESVNSVAVFSSIIVASVVFGIVVGALFSSISTGIIGSVVGLAIMSSVIIPVIAIQAMREEENNK